MVALTERDKLRALLPHWIEHNTQHATEFRRWVGMAGEAEADIEAAAAQMDAANEALAAALEKLGGPASQPHLPQGHSHSHEH